MYWYLQQLLRPKIYILCLQRSLWQRLLVFRILCLRQQLAWQRNLYTPPVFTAAASPPRPTLALSSPCCA